MRKSRIKRKGQILRAKFLVRLSVSRSEIYREFGTSEKGSFREFRGLGTRDLSCLRNRLIWE